MIKTIPAVAEKRIVICDRCRKDCNISTNYKYQTTVNFNTFNLHQYQADVADEVDSGLTGPRYNLSESFHYCDNCANSIKNFLQYQI